MNQKTLFISVSLIIVISFIIAIEIFQPKQSGNNITASNISALERIDAPTKGPKNAKVTIVEFFDPACETCSVFYPFVNDLVKKYPGKVNVMMRYAPLHKGSDQFVKLLEAAHLQGQFWPAVEILFKNQQRWTRHHVAQPQSARTLLGRLPLDKAKFNQDVSSKSVASNINQDLIDGKTLKVKATPQFFVNGKPLINFGYQPLTELVEQAIAEAY